MSDATQEIELTLTVNGVTRTAAVPAGALLAEALRDQYGVTGPKVGCATGDCGACTVRRGGEIVKSCLELAAGSDRSEIVTIEGLAEAGELTAVQQAFWDEHAFQCGFCLSGMVFAAEDLLRANPRPTEDEIRWAISGNLCRCTGYDAIVRAIATAAERSAAAAGADSQVRSPDEAVR